MSTSKRPASGNGGGRDNKRAKSDKPKVRGSCLHPKQKNVISLLYVPVNATTHAYTLGQETMGCASKEQRRHAVYAAHDQCRRFWYLGHLRHE